MNDEAIEAAATRIYNECRLSNPKFAMPYDMCEELAKAALTAAMPHLQPCPGSVRNLFFYGAEKGIPIEFSAEQTLRHALAMGFTPPETDNA